MGKVKVATLGDKTYACKIVKRPVPGTGSEGLIMTKFMSNLSTNYTNKGKLTQSEMDDQRLIREMALTLILDHPYIVSLHEVAISNNHYYLFLDLVDGTQVLDFIISHGKLKEKFAQNLMSQLISAVDYCHQNSIVHRDLKIENILINKKGCIQLIDFGLANLYSYRSFLSTFCGSLYFAAPELLSAKKYVGPEVDIWSLGVILYVLTCGKVPFDDSSLPELHAKIKAGVVDYPPFLSPSLKHLLSRMLVVHPLQRASLKEIKSHGWLARDSPIKNYLPNRSPLNEPFDIEVINRMDGFQFGSPEEIRRRLISVSKETVGAIDGVPCDPIVSIYHLVKERLEKQSDNTLNSKSSPIGPLRRVSDRRDSIPDDLDKISLRTSSQLSMPKNSFDANIRRTQSMTMKSRLSTKSSKSRMSRGSTTRSAIESPSSSLLTSLKSRVSKIALRRDKSLNKSDSSPLTAEPIPPAESAKIIDMKSIKEKVLNFFTGFKKTSKSKSDVSSVPSHTEDTEQPDESLQKDPLLIPAVSSPAIEIPSTAKTRNSVRSSLKSFSPFKHQEKITESNSKFDRSRPGQIDDIIERKSMKGMFSVSTTSTKPPHLIRELIFLALKKLQKERVMSFYERQGAIIVLVSLNQTNEKNNVSTPKLLAIRTTSNPSSSVGKSPLISAPVSPIDISNTDLSLSSSRPRISTGMSRSGSFSDRESILETEGSFEGDPGIESMARSEKVTFEIRICKVALMNMHSIQFVRVDGDSFQYKNICSRFLELIRL
ncbi:kinase-like domain-containing protein [Globomyces pollinis-pini]|nr:kinase-like domain-containing protein [Globomyces pollinis-pini]